MSRFELELNSRDIRRQDLQHEERLIKLRCLLDIEKFSARMNLETYKKRLKSAFPTREALHKSGSFMTMEMLHANEAYQHWQTSGHSCLLVLSGQNRTGDNSTTLSWLSPAAVLTIENLRRSEKCVAYYCCQVDYTMSDRRCPPLQEIMACLVYQIVTLRPTLVQTGSYRIEAAISSNTWRDVDEEIALEAMRACLIDLLSLFEPEEEITLVLDRVDRCSSGDETLSGQVLLTQLLELVLAAPCILKILIVASSTSWKIRPDQRERLRRKGGKHLVDKLDWHQESDRSLALSRFPARNVS